MAMRHGHLAPEHQVSAVDRRVLGEGRMATDSAIEKIWSKTTQTNTNKPKQKDAEKKDVKTRRGGRARLNAPDSKAGTLPCGTLRILV